MYSKLLLLACACVALAQVPGDRLGPTYLLQTTITIDNSGDRMQSGINSSRLNFKESHYEWENYDGWFNNPAHPEWGGAGKFNIVISRGGFAVFRAITIYINYFEDFPLERKTPVVYEDGVYEIVAERRRGNVLVISNLTQHGLSGLGSARRTAFFIFFGKVTILPLPHTP